MNWLLTLWRKVKGENPDLGVPLFCECNDVDCLVFLPIEEEVYLQTRARHPNAALVLAGHEDDTDTILERHDFYFVVQAR
jgi:hypothetical protein